MKKIISITLVLTLFLAACGGAKSTSQTAEQKIQSYESAELKPGDWTVCPVMGKKFQVKEDTLNVEIKGKKIYLCCQGCVAPITTDPDKYLGKGADNKEDTGSAEDHSGHGH